MTSTEPINIEQQSGNPCHEICDMVEDLKCCLLGSDHLVGADTLKEMSQRLELCAMPESVSRDTFVLPLIESISIYLQGRLQRPDMRYTEAQIYETARGLDWLRDLVYADHVICTKIAPTSRFTGMLDRSVRRFQSFWSEAIAHAEIRESWPLRLLVVDDEEIVRDYLADLFETEGHLVLGVESGEDGVAALKTQLFDIVFTDINMPGMDGMELLKQSRIICPRTEVVIVTGYATVQNASESVRFGACDYLTKPFADRSVILTALNRVAEKLRLKTQNEHLVTQLRSRNQMLGRYAESLQEAMETIDEERRALVHADRMATLGRLSAGVAHEINNPTTFIRGNIQTLERIWDVLQPLVEEASLLDEAKRKFILEEVPALVGDMLSGTERIAKIVSALRSFAHQGETTTRVETDVNQCIRDALALVNNRIKNEVQVEAELDDSLPRIQADPQQIAQVFVNLFVNAADAMEHLENALLSVRTYADGSHVCAEVKDNGYGFTPENQERMFDPFYTTKSVGKGTGLGLSILLGILEEHGGSITAESGGHGMGSRFLVSLPFDGMPVENPADAVTVLLAIPNRQLQKIMESTLGTIPAIRILQAETGNRALDYVQEGAVDLVVADLIQPDMDGVNLIRYCHSRSTRSCRVAVLAAQDGAVIQRDLSAIGVMKVFSKPPQMRLLVEWVKEQATAVRNG